MNQFCTDVLKRIKYNKPLPVTFYDLPNLMEQFAYHIPFENIDVMKEKNPHIDKQFLYAKIVEYERGGLCYELNPLFFYLLEGLGFHVQMIQATIDSPKKTLMNTHIATVLTHQSNLYLIDVGFGANQALQPVPFSGKSVHSASGTYRVCDFSNSERYAYEKYIDNDRKIRYIFSLKKIGEVEINQAKQLITKHEDSPFNKKLLITKTTIGGHKTLTNKTYTIVDHSHTTKEEMNAEQLQQISENGFGIDLKKLSC